MKPTPVAGNQAGFTVFEIFTTLGILLIFLTSGIPAFQGLIKQNQHTSHVNQFVAHLHYSRSEAIKRSTRVVMCRGDRNGCAQTEGWHEGWLIFADSNLNRELDNGETILQLAQGWDDGITTTSGRRRRIVYQPNGSSPGTNGTYVFCHPDYQELARAIILSNTGRPRLSKKRPDGSSLSCG